MAKTKIQGVTKRKGSRFYWIAYQDLSGKTVRKSSGTTNYKEAVAILSKHRQEVFEGKVPEIKKIKNYTFRQLSEEYVDLMASQKDWVNKTRKVKQLVDYFGDLPLRHFNSMLVEKFKKKRLEEVRNKPATVNRFLATLKHMFTMAEEWEMVEEEFLKKVRKVKLLKENNMRLRYLLEEEAEELIQNCESHLQPIVQVALNTGMRKQEILTLKWDENIDLKNGFILLTDTKNDERRELPMNNAVRGVLEKQVRRIDVPWVFYNPKTGVKWGDMKRSFYSALRRAGIRNFRFHDLRHTFASHLVMAGVDITTVKELLGHKTLSMTLRYAHLAPSHKVAAVDLLNERLLSGSTSHLLHILGAEKQKRVTA